MNTTTTSITTVSADGSATRSEITGVKKLTIADLSVLGLKRVNAKAAAELKEMGAYIPAGASPELLTVMASCAKNTAQAAKAMKIAAVGLALAEESGEYKILHGPDGKLYPSFNAFCESVLPNLSDTSRKSYLNVARTIYLPAARGELEKELMPIADFEPGTAVSACGVLNDSEARKRLPAALEAVMKGKKRLTQSLLKKAASDARRAPAAATTDPAATPATPTTDPVAATDATTATANTAPTAAATPPAPTVDMAGAVYSAIVRIFAPELFDAGEGESELTMATRPDEYKDMFNLLKAACENGDSALMFCKAFRQAVTNAIKSK